jgi:hypothetical protein
VQISHAVPPTLTTISVGMVDVAPEGISLANTAVEALPIMHFVRMSACTCPIRFLSVSRQLLASSVLPPSS